MNIGFRIPYKPVALVDTSHSFEEVFGRERLEKLIDTLKGYGFDVKTFGSDTSTDIYSALKKAGSPALLISDGMHNGSGDPLSAVYDREVNVLIPKVKDIPSKITHVFLNTPSEIGRTYDMRVLLSSPLNDTLTLVYGKKKEKVYATDRADFKIKIESKETEAKLISGYDTLTFKIFGREPKGVGILVWSLNPVIRFLRWYFTDATLKILKDRDSVEGKYSFTVLIDPPHLNFKRPSLYILGPKSGYKALKGTFYIRGDVPPIREIYVTDIEYDRVYEKVNDYPLIASKGGSLFVLSSDIWKVWLANPASYERFLSYLRNFVATNYAIYSPKPLYAPDETFQIRVYPPFPVTVSVNGGKGVGITSLYIYTHRLSGKDTLFTVSLFREGVKVVEETVRINLRRKPAEKVYIGLDTTLLKNLAILSGGEVFNNVKDAAERLKNGRRTFNLSSVAPLFILVVISAWVEWFVRRSKGMV